VQGFTHPAEDIDLSVDTGGNMTNSWLGDIPFGVDSLVSTSFDIDRVYGVIHWFSGVDLPAGGGSATFDLRDSGHTHPPKM
jgi:hypothetical protein